MSSSHINSNILRHWLAAAWLCLSIAVLLTTNIASAQQPADVRLVVDISGSMKLNDPQNLRQPAVDLLVKLLPENSKAGVWTFGQYVNMLVPHKPVDENWAKQAQTLAKQINSVGLYTNIGEALDKAAYAAEAGGDYQTSIILLTDGMVDIDKNPAINEKEWRRIVDEVIPTLAAAGIHVHTIALSDNADNTLLSKIALNTGGRAAVAKTADELLKAFLNAFDQAVPAEQLPIDGNSFFVDSSVEEFTALIFKQDKLQPSTIIGPDQHKYSAQSATSEADVNWHSTLDYDLITIQRPLEGEWIVDASIAPDSRITVVSDLNLIVKPLPANIFTGQNLSVELMLQEEGSTISDENFLQLLNIGVEITSESDRWVESLSNAIPNDGIYRTTLEKFATAGDYTVKILVDGKTFTRQFKHRVTVRDAFSITVKQKSEQSNLFKIIASPFLQTLDLDKTNVIARIKSPSRQSKIAPLVLAKNDIWQLEYEAKEEGTYELSLSIDVVEKDGSRSTFEPKAMSFSYPDGKVAEGPMAEPKIEEPPDTQEAEVPPEPEPSGTPWWVYAAIGGGNLLVFALAFIAYRMIFGKKSADGEEAPKEKKPKKAKEKPAKEKEKKEETPKNTASTDSAALAMADISDDNEEVDLEALISGSDDEDESDAQGMDISSDEGLAESGETFDELPEAPMDDLDALLADAEGDESDADEEFTLDDFSGDESLGDLIGDDGDEEKDKKA
ncbi:VWA domain-containing protein [Sessilibacter sp. MAH4]